MNVTAEFFQKMNPFVDRAIEEMYDLEKGILVNADEKRMVGHYWLREPAFAPNQYIRNQILNLQEEISDFVQNLPAVFSNVLMIGIGGSALGPQLLMNSLGNQQDPRSFFFFDNTDPDGMERVLEQIKHTPAGLAGTLVLVISKSGGTQETKNGQIFAEHAWRKESLVFAEHAVAITLEGSNLYQLATEQKWRALFPLWDWIGGRTSLFSAVGLLPLALQNLDVAGFLLGGQHMDEVTRQSYWHKNPALLLALCWWHAKKNNCHDMVVLPYKDRLELLTRYLQQLVMESLGKETNRAGQVVHEGLVVYGNKGSTDQHAYVQQLRDGIDGFFVNFIHVLQDQTNPQEAIYVEPGITSGDYLLGFLLGTQKALHEKGRPSLTLSLSDVSAYGLGALVALYERAVGFYASFVNINAYHQPGVEAGKKAASEVLALQKKLVAALTHEPKTLEDLCKECEATDPNSAWFVLEHLVANGRIQHHIHTKSISYSK